jgi:hypothetical protein
MKPGVPLDAYPVGVGDPALSGNSIDIVEIFF